MKTFTSMLTICLSLCVLNVARAGMPETDELLSKAASFERWGERMFNIGDVTAAEAAFYQAKKLQAEAEELQLADADLRSEPIIQRLALLVEDRLDLLNDAQEEVSGRLQELEEQITRRLEGSNDSLRIDLDGVIGDIEQISTQARDTLHQLRGEFAEFGEQLLADRDRDEEEEEEDDRPRFRQGRTPPHADTSESGHHDPQQHEGANRPRRIHLHAALGNLSAPPVHHHLHESIKHLHAAGMHDVAEQLDRALDMARERVKGELGDERGPRWGHHRSERNRDDGHRGEHGHHGERDREHGEHGHHRAHGHDGHHGDHHPHHARHGEERENDRDRDKGEHNHGHHKPHDKDGHHPGGERHAHHGDHDRHHHGQRAHHDGHHRRGHGPHHGDRDHGGHGHKDDGQLKQLQHQVRELTERLERIENAMKKKHKSRDDD